MTEFKITKKWSKKGKLLRAIILGALGNNNNKFFDADDHACDQCNINQEVKDERKQSSTSVFCKLGFLPSLPSRVVPSSGLNGLRKLGRAVSMRKHEQDEASVELCKKRIIMGRKCRPLNVSGALHYDKNGILVPELLLSPYDDSII